MPTRLLRIVICLLGVAISGAAQSKTYLGFDKNDYPGDDLLPTLHKTFAYTGYWLNVPPGATYNPWIGKRSTLIKNGFGFLILFNGRMDSELKKQDPAPLGRSDAEAAINAARKEVFPKNAIIFLDQEEGGHLMPEQAAYLWAWVATIRKSAYRAGIYCSGIPVPNGPGKTITTAEEIHAHDPDIVLWVVNDSCPPSPGCRIPAKELPPSASGTAQGLVWQYARSPRMTQFTAKCVQTYASDNNCYAPGLPHSTRTFIDLNTSHSADPSEGR